MFAPKQTELIVEDIFRSELVRRRRDALAFFDTQITLNLSKIPPDISRKAVRNIELFFGFTARHFDSLRDLSEQAAEAYQENQAVCLATSGSTGEPKQIRYSKEMMEIEAVGVGKYFKDSKRLITLTPRQHLYGLSFAVWFPAYYPLAVTNLPPLPLQPWHKLLREGDVLCGFPLFWEYFLKAGNTFPDGVTAVTSTAPCPKGLFMRLKQAKAKQVIELYGATETGGIGVRYNEDEPFQINDFWDISFESSTPLISRKGIEGRLPFPDEAQFVPPRGVFPLKRMDRIVQVAGVNVSLEYVEKKIMEYPAVKECRVRLMRPEEGRRLKAFIVLKEGFDKTELPQIRKFLAENLTSHQMPRAFAFGETLPVNSMGKLIDW
ncbi:MAG: AMP-binding protein [Elusimicrobiaceae bacterium]